MRGAGPTSVIFDVGKVLYRWEPELLYARRIPDDAARAAFVRDVVSLDWHFQHDAGRPFAETSAELAARHPCHAEDIRAWGPNFLETLPGPVEGMPELVAELDAAGVPLFAITNFSGEFWRSFVAREAALFDRFRGIVVSGDEKIVKPDPAIFRLALDRFGLAGPDALFVDDVAANVTGAESIGIRGHLFIDASTLRTKLVQIGLLDSAI